MTGRTLDGCKGDCRLDFSPFLYGGRVIVGCIGVESGKCMVLGKVFDLSVLLSRSKSWIMGPLFAVG